MEKKENIVIGFGRFQPPTAGHHEMAQTIQSLAELGDANHAIFTFQSHGDAKNPLPPDVKLKHMRTVLDTGNVFQHPDIRVPGDVFQLLHNQGFKRIILVAGGSRAAEYEKFRKYFGKRTTSAKTGKVLDLSNIRPEDFNVHRIDRDADSDTGGTDIHPHMIDPKTGKMKLEFVSGSRMRASVNDTVHNFMRSLPHHVTLDQARELQADLQKHMKQLGLNEEVSAVTRLKLARAAKRTASRRKIVRRSRAKRRRNLNQLKKRAKNEIISQLRKKLTGKRNWKNVPYSQRVNVDRNLNRKKKLLNVMVKRIMPEVIRGEGERLRNLNNSFNPIVGSFFSNYLTEKKQENRQPPDQAQKARTRRKNTNNQRNTRGRSEEKIKSGNIRGEVYVIKNKKTGDIEIVDKKSLNKKNHDIIVDAKDASKGAIGEYLKQPGFVNTITSIRIFGKKVKDAGDSKSKGESPSKPEKIKEKKSKAKNKAQPKTQPKTQAPKAEPLPMPNMTVDREWSMPKGKQQRGFKAADQEFAVVANLEYLLNRKTPEDLIKEGKISEDDHKLMLNNQNLQQSALRAAQNLIKTLNLAPGKHKFFATGRMRQQLSESFRAVGASDTTMKSDIVIMNEDGSYLGVSVKYGSSQIGSPKDKELTGVMNHAWEKTKEKMSKQCKNHTRNFIDEKLKDMAQGIKLPGTVGAIKKNVGGYAQSNPRLKKQVEGAIKANKNMQKDWDKLMEICTEFTDAVTRELLTAEGKFSGTFTQEIFEKTGKKVNAGIASHVLSISEDGRASSLDVIDGNMLKKIKPDLKFYIAMKTTDCGNSAQMKFYKTDFKPKLLDAAKKGDKKGFERLVKIAQAEFKKQGVVPPKFTKDDINKFAEQARDGTVANALKFKKHCSKSAFRVGKPGESGEEEIEESIVTCFIKRYTLNEEIATTSITGDPVYTDEDLDLTNINPDPEDVDADAWLEYTREYINGDLFKFLEFMGLDFDQMTTSEVNFGDIFTNPQSSRTNLIFINGQPKYIPVFDGSDMNEDRDYKSEYKNYHSKPKQRANRSKRVLARRLMMKLGKVHKGDGKDVDHKDGNPQNNGKSNLRVRDKSENRADN